MVKSLGNISNIKEKIFLISVFAFYGLFLSIPNGYRVSAVFLFFLIFLRIFYKDSVCEKKEIRKISIFLFSFGIFMSHSFDDFFVFDSDGDYFSKYILGGILVFFLAEITLKPKLLAYAIVFGCATTGAVAITQYPLLGRAEGYTNAIRFGNLAMFMAMACWIFLASKKFNGIEKLILFLGSAFGVVASILSLSRGGWLIIFLFPFVFLFFTSDSSKRKKILGFILFSWIFFAGIFVSLPMSQKRILEAHQEVSNYLQDRKNYTSTSVGARLEHWRLSWKLGWDKPITGWGVKGVEEARNKYIDSGEFHPFIKTVRHSHNEFLEMWATRGIFGVCALIVFYIFPCWIFWPKRKYVEIFSDANRNIYISLSLIGLMLPVSYLIFGLTDVFFNLAIGHNFFIISILFLMASIEWVKRNDKNLSEYFQGA